jgi:hypothetical protein
MTFVRELLGASPVGVPLGIAEVTAAIEASMYASQACTACADACLFEDSVAEMRACIGLAQACADICGATSRILSRPGSSDHLIVHRLLRACVQSCASCARECERHAPHYAHCAICARACRACEHACTELLDVEAFAELSKLAGG